MPPRNWRYTSGLIFGMLLGVLIAIGLMLLKPVDRMHEITALLGSSGIGAAVGIAAVAMRNPTAAPMPLEPSRAVISCMRSRCGTAELQQPFVRWKPVADMI